MINGWTDNMLETRLAMIKMTVLKGALIHCSVQEESLDRYCRSNNAAFADIWSRDEVGG